MKKKYLDFSFFHRISIACTVALETARKKRKKRKSLDWKTLKKPKSQIAKRSMNGRRKDEKDRSKEKYHKTQKSVELFNEFSASFSVPIKVNKSRRILFGFLLQFTSVLLAIYEFQSISKELFNEFKTEKWTKI